MRVHVNRLKEVAIDILKGLKASDEEAALVAEILVQADMRGTDTHGVHLLTVLSERVDAGMVQIPTNLTVIKEDDTTGIIDGGNGLGQVAVHRAMTMSIQKAKEFGWDVPWFEIPITLAFSHLLSLMAAQEGMIGIVMSNAASAMSPWGGTEAFLGTNPISFAAPGGQKALWPWICPPLLWQEGRFALPSGRRRVSPRDGPSMRQGLKPRTRKAP